MFYLYMKMLVNEIHFLILALNFNIEKDGIKRTKNEIGLY